MGWGYTGIDQAREARLSAAGHLNSTAGIEFARIHRNPTALLRHAHLKVQVGTGAPACAAHPANHLTLAHPVALAHVELGEMAVKGVTAGIVVFDFDGQAVAAGITTAHHPAGEGGYHGGALGGGQIAAAMHQPGAEDRVEAPAESAGDCSAADQGEDQGPVAVATDPGGSGGYLEDIAEPETAGDPGEQGRDRHGDRGQGSGVDAVALTAATAGIPTAPSSAVAPCSNGAIAVAAGAETHTTRATFPRRKSASAAAFTDHLAVASRKEAIVGSHFTRADHAIAKQVVETAVKALGGLNLALIETWLEGLRAGAESTGGWHQPLGRDRDANPRRGRGFRCPRARVRRWRDSRGGWGGRRSLGGCHGWRRGEGGRTGRSR